MVNRVDMRPPPEATSDRSPDSPMRSRVVRRIVSRLVPFLAVLYFFAFLDRVNIGFAALTMNRDIGLSATAFGIGSGIFFLGYVLFEIPSNLILSRVGARRWIARIMVTWGVLSAMMALATGPTSFYVLRFLLGAAEAGFFPGIVFYLSSWVTAADRAKIMGSFMVAIPVSQMLGAPVSTFLLSSHTGSLAGWQWLFVLEGIPAIFLGVAVLFVLPDSPANAKWLDDEERAWLQSVLRADAVAPNATTARSVAAAFDVRFLLLGLVYFGMLCGSYGLGFWLPQIAKGLGDMSIQQIGYVTAIPFVLAAIAMVPWTRHSDRTGERRWHVAGPTLICAGALVASAVTRSPVAGFCMISVACIGHYCALPVFWTLPTALLGGTASAASIALVNALGNIGGYVGPFVMGVLKDRTGGYAAGLILLAAFWALAALILLLLGSREPAGTG